MEPARRDGRGGRAALIAEASAEKRAQRSAPAWEGERRGGEVFACSRSCFGRNRTCSSHVLLLMSSKKVLLSLGLA